MPARWPLALGRRWGIELDFRSIKQTLGLDVPRCTSAAMVAKEIWAHLLAYDLIRTVMAEAASRHALTPRTIGFKHAMQLWSARQRHGARLDEEGRRILCGRIAQRRVGNRGGRREPGAI